MILRNSDILTLKESKNQEAFTIISKEQQLNSSKNISKNCFKINDKIYYFKGISEIHFLINELIGSQLASLLGLPTVKYKLVKIIDPKFVIYGIMSPSWETKDKICKAADEVIPIADLKRKTVFKLLKWQCPTIQNYNELETDLYKLSLLDFYTSQIDRVPSNFMFNKDNKGLHLNEVFDYTASFNTLLKSDNYPYFYNTAKCYTYFNSSNLNSLEYICGNYLFTLSFPSQEVFDIYGSNQNLKEALEKLYKFDLTHEIKQIEDLLGSTIPIPLMEHYQMEEEQKRMQLEIILDNIKR